MRIGADEADMIEKLNATFPQWRDRYGDVRDAAHALLPGTYPRHEGRHQDEDTVRALRVEGLIFPPEDDDSGE